MLWPKNVPLQLIQGKKNLLSALIHMQKLLFLLLFHLNMHLNRSICLSELFRYQMPHASNYYFFAILFIYFTFCGGPVALPATPEVSHGGPSSSSATLQQKACASLTRLCHRYAPKCQLSHTEKIGGAAPVRTAATYPLATCHA